MPTVSMSLHPVRSWSLGRPVAQCQVVPIRLGSGKIDGIAVAHTTNVGSNPWGEMFSFPTDAETYRGHSDTIQPFLDPAPGQWRLYVTREKLNHIPPRVAVYDAHGQRLWGDLDRGHIHIGWVARLRPDRLTAMAIRIGEQKQTRQGRQISSREVFAFDASTGQRVELPFDPFQTIPVDLNGDGLHELVRGRSHGGGGNGTVLDGQGRTLGSVGGQVSLASKILDLPGEQVLTHSPDGTLRLWADGDATDSPAALRRYAHPFYRLSQRLTGGGNHLCLLGGI